MDTFILSIKKNLKGIIFIIAASLLTAVGQLLWKLSNDQGLMMLIWGFLCYGAGAILMIIAFRYGSLSVLHPMLSFGYIFAIILGRVILKEEILANQIIAIIIIVTGVILIGGGDE